MADEKLNTGPEAQKTEEAPAPAVADPVPGEAAVPEHPPEQAEPGDLVISAEQIDALMAEKRQAARAEVEKANVYPYKLIYKDRAWYLFAFCLSRNENRLFRLSRIKNLILTEVHFERKTDICQYHSVFPMPEEIGNLIDLELEFTLDVGYRLFDTLDDAAIVKHENGYTVKITLPENNWLYDFLMSFGDKVTIVRPKSIRQTLKAKHETARAHHKGE